MTREEKVIIYTMGILENARSKGLRGGNFRMGEDGIQAYRQLRAEGFQPTMEEIDTAYVLLQSPPEEVKQAYRKFGKIKFEWAAAHKWIWMMLKRMFKK